MGSAGTQSAALCFGGHDGAAYLSSTEKFNGNTWTTNAGWNLSITKRQVGSAGTQSAALCFGGLGSSYTKVTEKFDGLHGVFLVI